MNIFENKQYKILTSPSCNYLFNKENGFMAVWGKTKDHDPNWSKYGPFIADIEISTVCNKNCKFCYKNASNVGDNMSLATFKKVFSKLPRVTTQIAFGIGSTTGNPELFDIMQYTRDNGVIPNITVNGKDISDDHINKLVDVCGAVAVSHYNDEECYGTVKRLTDAGLDQCNIHQLVSKETYNQCLRTIKAAKSDPRLEKLNAIVFLALKPKGDRNNFTPLGDRKKYKALIDLAFEMGVNIGFDSCSASLFLEAIKDHPRYKEYEQLTEPCESMLFSVYINTLGEVTPCSFMENTEYKPINILDVKDFKEIWMGDTAKTFRKDLFNTAKCQVCRSCPKYDIY
jgi:radical SAM protein with 4Fe4S-binding SPASM domain